MRRHAAPRSLAAHRGYNYNQLVWHTPTRGKGRAKLILFLSFFWRRGQSEVGVGEGDGGTGGGDVQVGGPEDGVDDHAAEGFDLEIAVEMAQRGAEGAAFIGAFVSPSDDDVLVLGGHLKQGSGGLDGGVQIVFVVQFVFGPTLADGMFGLQLFEGRFVGAEADVAHPGGSHQAEPAVAQLVEILLLNGRGPVNGDQAHAGSHQFFHLLAVRGVEQKFGGGGGVDDDGFYVFQRGFVFRPTVGNDRFHARRLLQTFGQHAAGVQIHVRTKRMVGLFANQQNFGRRINRRNQQAHNGQQTTTQRNGAIHDSSSRNYGRAGAKRLAR